LKDREVREAAAMIIQGIWNLRDQFKAKGATLVMLTTSGGTVPAELSQDVLVLDEPLPTAEDLGKIVDQIFTDSKVPKPKKELMDKAVDAINGLAAFPAEQTVSMCLSRNGLDYNDLWEAKRQAIEQVRGLSVWRGNESLSDIGGYEALKLYADRLKDCKEPPGCIVIRKWVDK
jgi:hypothetical protein